MVRPTGHKTPHDVEQWIQHHGFGLEHETARVLRDAGFITSLGRTYRDEIEHKPRDIDVVAEARPDPKPARIYAVVECKARTTGAWVVRYGEVAWDDDLWSLICTPALSSRLEPHALIVADILRLAPLGEPIPFAVIEAVDGADRDAAFGALSQAVSAARGWIAGADVPSIAIPMVVVDTPLYGLRYETGGAAELLKLKWSRVLWPDPGPRGQTAVEIVTRSALLERAAELQREIEWLAQKLVDKGVRTV